MKKCPYCAENVQDEAIKCKHCGEWLNEEKQQALNDSVLPPNIESEDNTIKCDTCEIEKPSENFANDLSVCKDCLDREPQNSPNENIKERDYSFLTKEKKIRKWGWGWLILFVIYLKATESFGSKYPAGSMIGPIASLAGIVIVILLYFKLRKWLFTWHVFYFKNWMASITAGVASFFIVIFPLSYSLNYFQAKQNISTLKTAITWFDNQALKVEKLSDNLRLDLEKSHIENILSNEVLGSYDEILKAKDRLKNRTTFIDENEKLFNNHSNEMINEFSYMNIPESHKKLILDAVIKGKNRGDAFLKEYFQLERIYTLEIDKLLSFLIEIKNNYEIQNNEIIIYSKTNTNQFNNSLDKIANLEASLEMMLEKKRTYMDERFKELYDMTKPYGINSKFLEKTMEP